MKLHTNISIRHASLLLENRGPGDRALTMADALSLVESLCHGCLSADRDLSPIGEFSDMFTMICQRKVRVPGMTDIYICWECTATLKRIQNFNRQVNKAQNKLRLYIRKKELQCSLPKSLSKLNTSKTNHDFISLMEQDEPEPDIKPLDEIKEEDDADFADGHNETEELKQDPTFIVYLKGLDKKPQSQIVKRYDRISTAEEMCVKEQARPSELVSFRRIVQDSDARGTMCVEDIDYVKAELSINENIETHNSNNLEEHKPHVCNVCQACYRTLEEFESHVTSHEVYRCLVCGHRSPSMEAAGQHVTQHRKIFKCKFCDYCCGKIREFREHYKIAHIQFWCDYCGKKFKRKEKLEKHIDVLHTVHSFECKECLRTYSSELKLIAHIRGAHEVYETEETFCVECNMQCKNRIRFRTHLQNKHGDQLGRPSKKERVKCLEPGCDKSYRHRSIMMNHYQYVHQGQSQFYCSICDKYYQSKHGYNNHRLYTHEGAERKRDKICSVCGRGFSNNRILINHMRTHTGERPFACAVCDARFAQVTARNTHQKRHCRQNKMD